jgi:uncharacterized protein (DUF1499 family)
MSFDLSQLRFTVETKQLDDAITKVSALATSVAALNKPLSKLGSESRSTASDIDTTTKAVEENSTAIKKNQTVLERQESILKFMSDGYSKGQSSILAMGKASGLAENELQKLGDTIDRQRKLQGSEPFDKSIGAIKVLKNELGALREAYRQTIKAQSAEAEGTTFAALSTKQAKDLYREKFRLIEQFKDQTNTELTTYSQLKTQIRSLNADYLAAAKARNTLAGVDTIQQTKRRDQLQYLARATSVQLGDIGVSLAGGQNPLTVLIQQADQMRGIFAQVGASGEEMKAGLSSAFKQIVVGFKDVVLVLGQFVVGAFIDSGKAIAKFAADITFVTPALEYLRAKLVATTGETSSLVKAFDRVGSVIGASVALGVATGIAALVGFVLAYKEVITTSHELSVALSMSGAAIAITKNEALAMSSALASGAGTSMDFAKAITEIAKAGNLGKESISGIATIALELQKYAGIAVKDTVAGYSKLADDPVKALTELGAATGRVTFAQIEEVKSLVEVGKQHEAVAEAIKLKQESDSQAVAIQKGDLSDIEKLFHEVKDAIKLVKEEFYSAIENGANISALTTAWRGFAVVVSVIGFGIKQIGASIGAMMAGVAAITKPEVLTAIAGKNFASPALQEAGRAFGNIGQMRTEDFGTELTAHLKLNDAIMSGTAAKQADKKVDLEANKINREAIKAAQETEKMKSQYKANTGLTPEQRAKKIAEESATTYRLAAAKIRGAKTPEEASGYKQEADDLIKNIEHHYKTPKGKGQAGAIRDTLGAQQQQIENDRNEAVRNAKMAMDAINSEHKRGLVNDYDYSTQKASIEQKSLADSIKFYTAEIEIAKKKVNSKKEIETLEGKIKKAESDIKDKEFEKGYAQLEYIQKLRDATIAEIQTLVDKNKAQTLDNELIGLSAEKASELRIARLDSATALQAEHVAYLQRNGYAETSSAAYNLEVQKLREMTNTRKLDTEALMKQTEAARKKLQEDSDSSFNKETFSMDSAQRDLDFRNSVIGTYGEQREEMKRAYELEKNLLEVNRKKTEELEAARKRYNALLTGNKEIDAGTKADLTKEEARIEGVGKRQEDLLRQGNKTAIKELEDAKLEKFSEGVADALVTGMTQGAKAGKKKLRDLIVAELTKTITLNIQANVQALLSGLMGGGQGGGLLDMIMGKGSDSLLSKGFDWLGGLFGGGSTAGSVAGVSGVSTTSLAGIELASQGLSTLAPALTTIGTVAPVATTAVGGMGASIMAALGPVGLFAAGAMALFAIFGGGKDEIPTVLNDLALFNNSLIGLPFLELAIGSDEAAQGLRDVMYGLENSSPTMKKLTGETINLSIELMKATGDIAGAANLARNIGTRGMSESEIAVYDYNEELRRQIEAARGAAEGARAGAAAAEEARRAEEQLAQTRYDLAGKLDVLLGRKSQLEVDRAKQLLNVTDEAVISLTKMIWAIEDLKAVVDKSFGALKRAVEAERKTITEANVAATEANTKAQEARSKSLDSVTTLLDAIRTTKAEIEPTMTREQAKSQLDAIIDIAKATGKFPTTESMSGVLKALSNGDTSTFKTAREFKLEQAKTAAKLAELSRLTVSQVSVEQQMLDQLKKDADKLKTDYEAEMKRLDTVLSVAQAQLDKLNGIDTSIISVADAVKAFDESLASLARSIAAAPTNNTPDPVTSGGGSSGGGGGGSGGGSTSGKAPKYEDIAGQENKDIVAAYREYYSRNPDEAGYKHFVDSMLTGDKLMQAILGASAANPESADYKNAVKKGYDPLDPLKKFLKSKTAATAPIEEGAFAVGINNVPYDMTARIHKGERILPAADNRELFARLQSPRDNNEVLVVALREMQGELKAVKTELVQIKESNKKMKDLAEKDNAIGAPPTRAVL